MSIRVNPSEGSDSLTVAKAEATLAPRTATEIWVKPEITSFKPVSITQSNTFNPGDALSSLS